MPRKRHKPEEIVAKLDASKNRWANQRLIDSFDPVASGARA